MSGHEICFKPAGGRYTRGCIQVIAPVKAAPIETGFVVVHLHILEAVTAAEGPCGGHCGVFANVNGSTVRFGSAVGVLMSERGDLQCKQVRDCPQLCSFGLVLVA